MSEFDVITFGETMLRFTPPALRRLEQAPEYEVHVGGSESNTAVGLARLGMRACWLSRLTDNALGQIIARTLKQHGVDTSHVIWTNEDRVGLYFLEEGRAPRGSQVIYDRKRSAMANIRADEIPTALFQPKQSKLLHTTGISLGISPQSAAATARCVELAKKAGWLVSFDVNYRAKLWSVDEARRVCAPILQQSDFVFIPLRDARQFYGNGESVSPEGMLSKIASLFPNATIVMTMGAEGALAQHCESIYTQPAIRADEVGRLGGGDAFSAGFIYGHLTHHDLPTALRWGVAVAALKYSIPGDLPLIDYQQAAALVNQGSSTGISR